MLDIRRNLRNRLRIKILAATWLAYAGYYFCRKPFYIAKSSIGESLGLVTVDLAHLGTGFLIAYMAGQFSSAFFGRRLGPRLLLITGIGISIFSSIAFGLSSTFWIIMIWIILNGMAQGTGWPGCIGSLAPWFKRTERGSVLGIWATCYQLGSLAAASFAAFILGGWGWRWSFFAGAIVLLMAEVAVIILHPNTPEDAGLEPIDDPDDADSAKRNDESGWDRGVIMTIMVMGCIYFCIKFLRYALWSWLPFFLNRNFALSGESAGYLSTIFDIAGFTGVVVSGFVSDRLFRGRRAFLSFIMLAVMTLSFVALYAVGSVRLPLFAFLIGVAGFMLFGPDALLSGVGAIDVGTKRGALSAAGIINGMGSIGPIFQEQLVGWMYDLYKGSLLPILLMLVCVALAATALSGLLWGMSRKGKANL